MHFKQSFTFFVFAAVFWLGLSVAGKITTVLQNQDLGRSVTRIAPYPCPENDLAKRDAALKRENSVAGEPVLAVKRENAAPAEAKLETRKHAEKKDQYSNYYEKRQLHHRGK